MNIFKWLLYILTILYGSLMILGGASQIKQRKIYFWSVLTMIIGGVIIIVTPFVLIDTRLVGIVLMILSLLTIHISAVSNGIKIHGKINVIHHGIRLLISISIIILYLLSN